jgi:hypothetical protein
MSCDVPVKQTGQETMALAGLELVGHATEGIENLAARIFYSLFHGTSLDHTQNDVARGTTESHHFTCTLRHNGLFLERHDRRLAPWTFRFRHIDLPFLMAPTAGPAEDPARESPGQGHRSRL